jgi:serine phosphatase RsbU (regulator of sigma subunit)
VTNNLPVPLRLHVEDCADDSIETASLPHLGPLLKAFQQATGWQMAYEQSAIGLSHVWSASVTGSEGREAGRLVLTKSHEEGNKATTTAPIDLHQVRPLALAVGNLLSEIHRLQHALWQREAELAAGVPIAIREDDEPHLAERLEAVLKGGVEAVGCQAAGLYLLDEGTSELKLRAAWGLPQERLLTAARPLRGAMADLEALVGHAVVLEDTSLLPHWRCPEEFPAAVCLPVATPTVPLGTLWVFSDVARDFSAQETNLLEIIAGRLAADLEREMLLAAGYSAKTQEQHSDSVARWQSDRLPSIAPLLDDYEVAGWTRQATEIGGDFHDWSILPDGQLALSVASAHGRTMERALGAASLQPTIKSHAAYRHTAVELVSRVNESMLAGSAGDQRASLAYALVDPSRGDLDLALAGNVTAMLICLDDRQIIAADCPQLGASPDAEFRRVKTALVTGQILVLLSAGALTALDPAGLRIGESAVASLVAKNPRDSAVDLAKRLRKLLDSGTTTKDDLTVLILKRR